MVILDLAFIITLISKDLQLIFHTKASYFILGLSDCIIQILIHDSVRHAIPKIKNNKRWRVNNKALRPVNECSHKIYVNNTIKDLIGEHRQVHGSMPARYL